MSLGLIELKKNYNITLNREKNAEEYFNNPNISDNTKDKWLTKFTEIIIELSKMIKEYKEITGNEMTKKEVLNGFQLDSQ